MKTTDKKAFRNFALLVMGIVAGCSMTPYKSNFSCRANADYGQCMPVESAYQVAKNGTEDTSKDVTTPDEYPIYKEAVYAKLRRLIDHSPQTPMVNDAKVIRTLILPYTSDKDDKTLYMPRFAYSIVDEPAWVLGQFDQPPVVDAIRPLLK